MHASIIIPTHNREEILSRVLSYYACQARPESDFEILVVDDGSTDGTESLFGDLKEGRKEGGSGILSGYGDRILTVKRGWYFPDTDESLFIGRNSLFVRYIRIKKSGRSTARNVGIGFSAYPLLIFADDDIFVEPEFVKKHSAAHENDDMLAVMGKVIHTQDLENPFSATWKLKDINTAFLSTGNASVLKKYVIQAGLFDERYKVYGWEDFDLGIHLKEIGVRSVKSRIYGYHYDAPGKFVNPREVYEKEKERGVSAVYFYTGHPLKWVARFTLIHSRFLRAIFKALGHGNWFLRKKRISFFKGLMLLIIRYKGYFDGIDEGKKNSNG